MMRLTNQVKFLAAFLFMAACACGQDVHYNYDRSANFAAYKTYQWIEIPGGAVPDQLIDQAIKRAAEEQLAQKRVWLKFGLARYGCRPMGPIPSQGRRPRIP